MTLKQLQTLTEQWKMRLNLREWAMEVMWGGTREMQDLAGCCIWQAEEQCAIIKLNKQDKDKEHTLVHELLHLVLQGHLEEVPPYDVHLERSINKIAAALVQKSSQTASV